MKKNPLPVLPSYAEMMKTTLGPKLKAAYTVDERRKETLMRGSKPHINLAIIGKAGNRK